MKWLLLVASLLIVAGVQANAQVVADFEKNTGGFHVLTQYFGNALLRVSQKADPTSKSLGVMVLNFNFPPADTGNKGGVGANNAIVTNGAHFITYWVYMPPSTPDSLEITVFAQDNVAFAFKQKTYLGKSIPKNTWYPISLDLTQAQISDPSFNLTMGNIFLTGLQVDTYASRAAWQDSMLVDNVALVGAQPIAVASFETGLGGFANVNFGPALKLVAQVPDPTAKTSGVMKLNWAFPADTVSKGAVGLQQSGGVPAATARFITYWVYLPDTTMPDSFAVSVFAQDNKNYAYHDTSTLARNIPKKTWYPLSLDLAQFEVRDPSFNLVAGNIFLTGIQIDSYNYHGVIPGWKDSLYVDNVALLTPVIPPPLKKLVVSNFEAIGDVGGFAVQPSVGPSFTAAANAVDTTNAANRVLAVTASFDTGAVKVKGAIAKPNLAFFKQGDTSATDITFDVFVPASMPDSARFDLVLFGAATGNAWVQDEFMLGSANFQKGSWNTLDFSVSKHLADHSITFPRLAATFYVQVYYTTGKKWNGTLFFDNLTLLGIDALTGVSQNPNTPYTYRLYNNYPNPFNPTTTIRYELKRDGPVSLKVYDVLGQEVTTLVDAREGAGPHAVVFDANRFATGAYFYTLRAGDFVKTEKMLLLK